jgi:hypothetical protein
MRIFSRLDRLLLFLSAALVFPALARAQAPSLPVEQPYAFHHSWSIFSEYSPDSSHIFLGFSQQRKFFNIGGAFTQRLFLKKYVGLSYMAEIKPLMLESDPVLKELTTTLSGPDGTVTLDEKLPHAIPVISTTPSVITDTTTENGNTYTDTFELFYSRRWTYAFGLSPVGFRVSFLPHARIQPDLTLLGGFAVSPRDIPVFDSSAFNFTFSFGTGIEFFQRPHHATRIEYRIQHLSNKDIGFTNPGIDSQMIQASFVWGK